MYSHCGLRPASREQGASFRVPDLPATCSGPGPCLPMECLCVAGLSSLLPAPLQAAVHITKLWWLAMSLVGFKHSFPEFLAN